MIKKFSEHINEVQKMSFMDIVRGSGGNMPEDAEVVGNDTNIKKPIPPTAKSKTTAAFDLSKYQLEDDEPVKPKAKSIYVEEDEEDEKPKKGKPVTQKHIELSYVTPGIKELLGKKLFIEFEEARKLLSTLKVKDFLESELRYLRKGMKYLKGSQLSGAKTKERLLIAKLEDAEDFDSQEETKPELGLNFVFDALTSSDINASNIYKNIDNLSLKFIIPEDELEDLKIFLSSIGAEPIKDQWGPVERWFSNGVEWRIYEPDHGTIQVASAFLKESRNW